MSDIYTFLDQLGVAYQRFDHLPVYTTEQANRLSPPMPGEGTKNLFLRDKLEKFIWATGHIFTLISIPERV